MKDVFLSVLREKNTQIEEFRKTTDQICHLIASNSAKYLTTESKSVETQFQKTSGQDFKKLPVLIVILRSGFAMLDAFLKFYPAASIGFLGMQRDHKNHTVKMYFSKLPHFDDDSFVFLLDPMLATGMSADLSIEELVKHGMKKTHITLFSILGSKEGVEFLKQKHPQVHLEILATDPELDPQKWIVPGLGDFGDRYFGI